MPGNVGQAVKHWFSQIAPQTSSRTAAIDLSCATKLFREATYDGKIAVKGISFGFILIPGCADPKLFISNGNLVWTGSRISIRCKNVAPKFVDFC